MVCRGDRTYMFKNQKEEVEEIENQQQGRVRPATAARRNGRLAEWNESHQFANVVTVTPQKGLKFWLIVVRYPTHFLAWTGIIDQNVVPLDECENGYRLRGMRRYTLQSRATSVPKNWLIQQKESNPKDCPELVHRLTTDNRPESKHLMLKILQNNSAPAMASTVTSTSFAPSPGPYCFCIYGQVYQNTSSVGGPTETNRDQSLIRTALFIEAEQSSDIRSGIPTNSLALEGWWPNLMVSYAGSTATRRFTRPPN